MSATVKVAVVYDSPTDLGAGFAVRLWRVTPTLKISPGGHVKLEPSLVPDALLGSNLEQLERARELVPDGMVNIGRMTEDDPTIVEVWL